MAHLPRLVSGVDQPPGPRAFASWSDDQQRDPASPDGDLKLARFSRANLLVVGDDDVVLSLVTSLWRSLATPIAVRNRGERLRLSQASQRLGTIVIYDVDTLTPDEQLALYELMGAANGRTQVVSTAAKSLQPMLEAGAFNEALYYRINVVTVDLTSPVSQ